MTNTDKPASGKQLKWLRDLLNQRDTTGWPEGWWNVAEKMREAFALVDAEGFEPGAVQVRLAHAGKEAITMKDFRRLLEKLQASPKVVKSVEPLSLKERNSKSIAPVATSLEDGMYKVGDKFYKVKHSQNNKQWAHKLYLTEPNCGGCANGEPCGAGCTWTGSFRYAGKPTTLGIKPEHALSYEDAKAFGALYNMCVCCGRLLTNELSIVLGIGPVCGKRQFGGEFKHMLDAAALKAEAASKKGA